MTSVSEKSYPGDRLGLPKTGPGSIAPVGRRIAALCVDWGCAWVISFAFFAADSWTTLLIFCCVQIIFIPLLAASPGHRVFGMRLERLGGGWVGLWRPVIRTLLLAIVIPAVIWDPDQRGLHDKAAGTVLLRA